MTDRNSDSLYSWWDKLSKVDLDVPDGAAHELCGLDEGAARLGLTPRIEVPCEPRRTQSTGFVEIKPSFKNLTIDVAVDLRALLHDARGSAPEPAGAWSETLLRYFEIFNSTIERRAKAKWGDDGAARLGLLHVTALFLEHYELVRDLRFLNAALKIQDIRAVYDERTVTRELAARNDSWRTCLLTVNVAVRTAAALQVVREGLDCRE